MLTDIHLVANGDLRDSANEICWEVQSQFEEKLSRVLEEKYSLKITRAHAYDKNKRHGFISSQRQGSDVFASLDENVPIIVLITAWQYSHHIANSLIQHNGPVLLLANFDGTWPGLVGMLNLAGSLTGIGREYSRLWSENFDDDVFYIQLDSWVNTGKISWDTSYLRPLDASIVAKNSKAMELGKKLGKDVLRNKEIIGLFDMYCMGMMNGVFPLASMAKIGLPIESLSQSALYYEMSLVTQHLREECLQFYLDRGMTFYFGENDETDLTRDQVLEQCAMLIALARLVDRFGLTTVGVQYQQGLKDLCPASDFVEGAIGSSERFPIPDEGGNIIREGQPIPHANEVDMGSAIPQTMLFKILDNLGLPSETTLHDVRWGSEYEGVFYWDFLISGSVPFEHIKNGISGAKGYRQPPMYFRLGGSTIGGQCKAGSFVWARAYYKKSDIYMSIGSGMAYELPEREMQRRLDATTPQWPLMNVTLDGISRDELMAGHYSNHITVAYVPEDRVTHVITVLSYMASTMGIKAILAGDVQI